MPRSPALHPAILVLCALTGAGSAQSPEILAVTGGRLLLDPASVPVEGTLVITDGKISAVGPDAQVPEGAKTLDAKGLVVAPAFIDAGNGGLLDPASWSAGPTGPGDLAADMVAAGDPRARWSLVRAGVGAVYVDLPPRSGAKGATGALALLDPDAPMPEFLERMAGSTFSLGGRARNETTLVSRKASHLNVYGALDAAKRYRESWKKHEKAVEEHEKKLKEWEEKQKKGEGAAEKKDEAPKDGGEKAKEAEKPAPSDDGKLPAEFKDWSREKQREYMRERMRKAGDARRAARGGDAKKDEKKDEKKEAGDERPKPPLPPLKEPAHEAVLRILDRKAPLRIEARWKEDIAAACEIAKKRDVRLVVLGADEAMEVVERLQEVDATVVLGPGIVFDPDPLDRPYRRGDRGDLAARLGAAAIPTAFMTAGANGFRYDSLPLLAQLAMGQGLSREGALRALTSGAARAVGAEDRLGALAPGRIAAVQLVSGELLEPGATVVKMILGTKVVDPRRSG